MGWNYSAEASELKVTPLMADPLARPHIETQPVR